MKTNGSSLNFHYPPAALGELQSEQVQQANYSLRSQCQISVGNCDVSGVFYQGTRSWTRGNHVTRPVETSRPQKNYFLGAWRETRQC